MKKIFVILFVTLGVNLQNVIAQNDSVVLPDYMYHMKHPKQHVDLEFKNTYEYKYDEQLGRKEGFAYFTIGDKKPVRINKNVNDVSYNNTCTWWYFKQNMIYRISNNIVASYCINEDECIIFVKTMEFYKFKYSDSSITYLSDLSETGLFDESIKETYTGTINEVNDILKNNPNEYKQSDRQMEIYSKFKGIRELNIGKLGSGYIFKVDSTWFLSFEYNNKTKLCSEHILLRSIDNMKTWTRSKAYLNYMYKQYDENLKKFIPFLLTFENVDDHLSNVFKLNDSIYFTDNQNVIYKSVDNGNIFKLYKIFKPFPTPVVPTFENTNH